MTIVETGLIFILVWWLVFFMALPIGVRRSGGSVPGADPGAPANPMLVRKALATTAVAGLLTGLAYWLAATGHFDLRALFDK